MDRSQMTFYASFWSAIDTLPKKDQLAVFRAAVSYGLCGSHSEQLSPAQNALFALMKPVLDSSRKKAANGKQKGNKQKQTEANKSKPKQTANEKENEEEKEVEIENEEENEIENECYLSPPTPLSPADAPSTPECGASENNAPSSLPAVPKPKETSGSAFTAFWEAYPKKIGREKAWNAWKQLNLSAQSARDILLSLEVWKGCDQWTESGGRYIPQAENFLLDRYWETTPPPKDAPAPKGSAGGNPFLEMAGDSYE